MFTLRPTDRLLDRLRAPASQTASPTTTRLGDWYANVLRRRPALVMFMAEKTFLPVLVPYAPRDTLVERFKAGVADVLRYVGIAEPDIQAELREMESIAYGRAAANRQVVGTMVRLALELDWYLEKGGSCAEVSARLAESGSTNLTRFTPLAETIALIRLHSDELLFERLAREGGVAGGPLHAAFLRFAPLLRSVDSLDREEVARRVLEAIRAGVADSFEEVHKLCAFVSRMPDDLVLEFLEQLKRSTPGPPPT